MGDVAEAKFAVVTECLPSEIERLLVCLRENCVVHIAHRAEMVRVIFAYVTFCIDARTVVETRAFFRDIFCFGSHRTMFHREVRAIAHGATVFSQVIAISEEKQLERFHFVKFSTGGTTGGFVGEVIQGLRRFPHRRGDLERRRHRHWELSTYKANVRANMMNWIFEGSSTKQLESVSRSQ